MVVALAELEDIEIVINALAYEMRRGEIERRALHIRDFADRHLAGVIRRILFGGNLERMVLNGSAGFALEVEIHMLCHCNGRRLVQSLGPVVDAPHVVLCDRICNKHLYRTGEPALSVWRHKRKFNSDVITVLERLCVPDAVMPATIRAVQGATDSSREIVALERVVNAIERELAVLDAVRVAPDQATIVRIPVLPAFGSVKTERDILAVRKDHAVHSAAPVKYLK